MHAAAGAGAHWSGWHCGDHVVFPGVRRVLGTSIIDGALHLVMPLAERGSLARRVRELGTGLPVGELVDVAEQMLEGLAHLHRAGLVHCDVKPHNLLLDRRGTVLLGDFGLAKISQERASMGVRALIAGGGARCLRP